MTDASCQRDSAEQALRIARDNIDPHLIKSLRVFAAEYNAMADAIDSEALGEDPQKEDDESRPQLAALFIETTG
jgi:hypothetical protein